MHGDPIAPVLLGVVVIILTARIGGHFFEKIGQPGVLGELLVGVLIGNLTLVGIDAFEFLKVDYTHHKSIDLLDYRHLSGVTIDHLARLGVILLLFEVGLETSIGQMRRVGSSALLVATIGVLIPIVLGWGCGAVLLPDSHWAVHMFLGAALCATSVGITARVLQDLGKSRTKESQIVLGAAVLDDVMGLVVLAFAAGIIDSLNAASSGGESQFTVWTVAIILAKALGFLLIALVLGRFISRPLFKVASFLRGKGLLIVSSLAFCFLFSWAADAAGLATIVGAFAAGLILEDAHYRELVESRGEHHLPELLKPLTNILVPIFFVVMGIHVDLRSLFDPSVLVLAAALTVAAIVGKQACSLGVLQTGVDRLSVGIAMIPRGEVGLIFAAIGLQLHIGKERVVDDSTYSALVVMVIATTLVTPPLLKWSMERRD
ncbi:MAG: cation:proton antiporter [Planctomycetaceae bacterium]